MADPRGLGGWAAHMDEWLASTGSEHTRRAYERAAREWLAFLAAAGAAPETATAGAARAWHRALRARGLSEASVNCRLAAVSSLYRHVMAEAPLDAPADNPLRSVRRGRVLPYGRANVLPDEDLRRLWAHLAAHNGCVSGARNEALLLLYFLTGVRAAEAVRMRWSDVRPHRSRPGEWVWRWRGKGGKTETMALPARAWEALMRYRLLLGDTGEFVWPPLQDHGTANLLSGRRNRPHISESNARRVFRQALRAAGVERWELYRLHDLRHTFAHLYYRQTHDLDGLRRLLHHGSVQTTDIYVRAMADPGGETGETVWSALECA